MREALFEVADIITATVVLPFILVIVAVQLIAATVEEVMRKIAL